MKKLKIITKKILRFIFIKMLFFIGMILIIANIIRLFYNPIGKFIGNTYSFFSSKEYFKEKDLFSIGDNFKTNIEKNLFLKECNIGTADAGGRFLIHINKICALKSNSYTLNHELIHYSLRNLPIKKKIEIRGKIKKIRGNIKHAVNNIDPKLLSGDDKKFYNILSDHIYKYSSMPSYNFYERIDMAVLYYWGNEEYIAYAIGKLVKLGNDKKLSFVKFELKDPFLKEIYNDYKNIYSYLIKTDN